MAVVGSAAMSRTLFSSAKHRPSVCRTTVPVLTACRTVVQGIGSNRVPIRLSLIPALVDPGRDARLFAAIFIVAAAAA